MISGTVILEDTTIVFVERDNVVSATITDNFKHEHEEINVPLDKFCKALSIAIHTDGMPDYKKDYDAAESIMGKIRWIA